VRRRVLLELSRFGPEVRRAAVHLVESRQPLGGADSSCRIRALLHSGRVLQAEAVDGQLEGAAARSAVRLALLVAAACGDGASRHGGPTLRDRGSIE
jgi:hypothetical protein